MIFSSSCPKCGQKKDYISEQAGIPGHCLECGEVFVLKRDHMKVFRHVAVATLAVMLGMGAVGGRSFWRAQVRAQARQHYLEQQRERREAERQLQHAVDPVVIDDNDDNDKNGNDGQ